MLPVPMAGAGRFVAMSLMSMSLKYVRYWNITIIMNLRLILCSFLSSLNNDTMMVSAELMCICTGSVQQTAMMSLKKTNQSTFLPVFKPVFI